MPACLIEGAYYLVMYMDSQDSSAVALVGNERKESTHKSCATKALEGKN